MAMMRVGYMRMFMFHRVVVVSVRVRFIRGNTRLMFVLMVLVVDVPMFMIEKLVRVSVAVTRPKQQHHARSHQDYGSDSRQGHRFAKKRNRQSSAEEWCRRKIRCLASCSELA